MNNSLAVFNNTNKHFNFNTYIVANVNILLILDYSAERTRREQDNMYFIGIMQRASLHLDSHAESCREPETDG